MSDLRAEENERLRDAMNAYAHRERINISELARRLEMKQPSLSVFLSGGGGASLATARRFAVLAGVGVGSILDGVAVPANTSGAEASTRFRELLDWFYATKGVSECVNKHRDVSVADLLRLRATPARHGETDPDQIYGHILQLRTARPRALPSAPMSAADAEREIRKPVGRGPKKR